MLVHLRKPVHHLVFGQPEQVDHHHPARALEEVAAVAVFADVRLQPRARAEPELARLGRRDDEACPVELDTRRAKPLVRLERHHRRHIRPHRQIGMDAPRRPPLLEPRLVGLEPGLRDDLDQRPLARPRLRHRHRDPHHRRILRRPRPRVVGDGEDEVQFVWPLSRREREGPMRSMGG